LATLKDKLLQNNIDKRLVQCIGVTQRSSSISSFQKHIFSKCSVIYDVASILFDFNNNPKKYLDLLKEVNIVLEVVEEIEIENEDVASEQKLFLNFAQCSVLNAFIFNYWLENIQEDDFDEFKYFTGNSHKRNQPSLLVNKDKPFEFFQNILVTLLSLDSDATEVKQFQCLCPLIDKMKISLIPGTEGQEDIVREKDIVRKEKDIVREEDQEVVTSRDTQTKNKKRKRTSSKKKRPSK